MWCHSGLGWWLSAMPSLKSESGADPILPTNRGDALASLLEYEDCQHKQEFQRQRQILKKQFCRRKVLLKSESLFLVAEAWMCHIVTGNNPLSGPMSQNCRNWCPATTLGMISKCGLICGASSGKQFQLAAVYWKRLLLTINLFTLSMNLSYSP